MHYSPPSFTIPSINVSNEFFPHNTVHYCVFTLLYLSVIMILRCLKYVVATFLSHNFNFCSVDSYVLPTFTPLSAHSSGMRTWKFSIYSNSRPEETFCVSFIVNVKLQDSKTISSVIIGEQFSLQAFLRSQFSTEPKLKPINLIIYFCCFHKPGLRFIMK